MAGSVSERTAFMRTYCQYHLYVRRGSGCSLPAKWKTMVAFENLNLKASQKALPTDSLVVDRGHL